MADRLKMPTEDVNVHILTPSGTYEIQKGKMSTLSIRSKNKSARLAPKGTVRRINKKPVYFDSWGAYLQARHNNSNEAFPVEARSDRVESYCLYRKDSFWPVPYGSRNELSVEYKHALVKRWLQASYKWARQRAAHANRGGSVLDRPNNLLSNVFSGIAGLGILWSVYNFFAG